MSERTVGLRERTRRAVKRDISEAAQRLILDRGYDATTIDDIAAEVGMSQRSVFRYFPTKEDIVIGKLDLVAEEMAGLLGSRPARERPWTSLRRGLDLFVPRADALDEVDAALSIQRLVFASPGLLASYLEKLDVVQRTVEVVLRARAHAAGAPYADDDPTPGALTAAAFGCLLAAQRAWLAGGACRSLADVIDEAMGSVRPVSHRTVAT